ncbi:MAG: lipopolysaccharide transport periplasmic protein LptA [Inhella sp.]
MKRYLPLLALALALPLAQAAKDDRTKPLIIESDQGGTINQQTGRTEWTGPVLLVQGSLQVRASRLEAERRADDSHFAVAAGKPSEPVRFSQALNTPGETLEGSAERIEYDTRAETVRFAGGALVRRMKGNQVLDELTGATIVYNSRSEILSVEPGQTSPQPQGKVRVVMMPRPAPAASAPAPAAPASSVPLQTTPALPPPKK